MFYECCILYVLFIDKCENGWKSYGNNCYLFGINKINWHEAKVSKIVINKIKNEHTSIYVLLAVIFYIRRKPSICVMYLYLLINKTETQLKIDCRSDYFED